MTPQDKIDDLKRQLAAERDLTAQLEAGDLLADAVYRHQINCRDIKDTLLAERLAAYEAAKRGE